MSVLHPPSFSAANNNARPAASSSSFVPESSLRSNVAFVGVVLAAVVLYKGARVWAWLGDKVKERRSLELAQELVSMEDSSSSRKDAGASGNSHSAGPDSTGAATESQGGGSSSISTKEPSTPARRRRKSKATAADGASISHLASKAGAPSPLSRPTPLQAPHALGPSTAAGQPANAIAGPSSPGGSSSAQQPPRLTGDALKMEQPFTLVSPHASKRPPSSTPSKGKGKGRALIEPDGSSLLSSATASTPAAVSPSSRMAKGKAAQAKEMPDAVVAPGEDAPSPGRPSRALVSSPLGSRKELSPPSSVSSVGMSAASSQAGGNSSDTTQATTLASSTLSLGLDIAPLASLSSTGDGPAPTSMRVGPDDNDEQKALRHELATALDRLNAAQGSLDATQLELQAARQRLTATEAELRTSEAEVLSTTEARDVARLLGEERAAMCEAARREADDLRIELRTRRDDAKRSTDEGKRRDREKDKLKRELDKWKEDGRRWELMEREYRRSDTELRFQLHHTSMACHQQLNQIRMLEQVVRQYNQAFAPAAAAASAALQGQSMPPSPVGHPPHAHPHMAHTPTGAYSLSPASTPSRPSNRRTPSKTQGETSVSPLVVLPPQAEVAYPTLLDQSSSSEDDVSDDVALSILKNPGGLGVGGSQRSRHGSVDSTCGSGSVNSSMSTRPDDERSDGGPAGGAASDDKGTPELVFATIPSYDEHSRPRSSATGSTSGDTRGEREDAPTAQGSPSSDSAGPRGRPSLKEQATLDAPAPSIPAGSSTQPLTDDAARQDVVTPRASGLPAAASETSTLS